MALVPQEPLSHDASSPGPPAERPARSSVSVWFRLAGLFGAIFCVTAFAWAVAGIGDQRHPMKAWLGRHGVTLIVAESLAVLATTLLGMTLPEEGVRQERESD